MSDDKLLEMRSIDLGIDSLVAIDLRTWFSKNLEVNISVLSIMDNNPAVDLALCAVDFVPEELVPMVTDRVLPRRSGDADESMVKIDWDVETTPPTDLAKLSFTPAPIPRAVRVPGTIVLTGASGFLGSHLLKTLLAESSIKKIHCLAVRRLSEKLESRLLPQDDRVVYHAGQLDQPRLGLSDETAVSIFSSVDAVIHNGADTSHLKSYFDLKPCNIGSTIELVRLCLPRRIPIHFVSSNAVGHYSNSQPIGEVAIYTPGGPRPPVDGSSGYRSTKWAAETLLERVHESSRLPIWIHRPSTIIRSGRDAEGLAAQLDWMNALIWYMDKLSAVPKLNHGNGSLDLVHPQTVCTGIISHVTAGTVASETEKVLYVHHMADLLIPLSKLEDFNKEPGRVFRQLPREDWIAEAVASGMHPAVAVLIEMVDAPGQKGPPMFLKGTGTTTTLAGGGVI
jgi:thioester reductase-like protein